MAINLDATCRLILRLREVTSERDMVLQQAQVLGLHLGQLTEPLLHAMNQKQLPDAAETDVTTEKARKACCFPLVRYSIWAASILTSVMY